MLQVRIDIFSWWGDISIDNLKDLLASELRFYEEFEEVIVYLTNLKPELFDEFVGFDPFIFKRHPDLTKEQQEKLLLSILNKFKVDFSQMWGRWDSFESSTLVKFEKLNNLIPVLEKHATLEEHGYYLMKLLENNYTHELQEYIFKVLEKNISDKKDVRGVIRGNFIDNCEFNLSLYEFLKKYDLLEKDTHVLMMSFEAELFSSLYGVKYKYKYGAERITERTDIDFHTIVPLLDFIPSGSLKYIAPYILKEDVRAWFQYVADNYPSDRYNYEHMGWVAHAALKHCDSVDSLTQIARQLQEKKIYLHLVDKKEMILDFKVIENIFWEVYFETDVLQDFSANGIVLLYDISLDNIKKATDKYPIKDYIKKYVYFRLPGNDVDKFLMQDEDFKQYMENLWQQREEDEKREDENFDREYPDVKKTKQLEEENFLKTIERFDTNQEEKNDLINIFLYAFNIYRDSNIEIDKYLQKKLSEKYKKYLSEIKERLRADTIYIKIKNDLLSNNISYYTIIYNYLFDILNDNELKQLVKTKKDYIKLFWHVYKIFPSSFSGKLIKLNENYLDCFIFLSLHTLQISIKQSKGETIGRFNLLIHAFKDFNGFSKASMNLIINYLVEDKNIIPKLKEFYEKEYLIEILALDKSNYSYILELMSTDENNMSIYLQYLLGIDTNKALEDFYKIYKNTKRYKSIALRTKEFFGNRQEISNSYDNPKINQEKKELYFCLIRAIKASKDILDNIPDIYHQKILTDYYKFFTEYKRPRGTYSPDIYDRMHDLINKIWIHMENSKYIDVLKELEKSNNSRLSDNAKYALTKAYEHQQKDRNYPNSYYKEMLDQEDRVEEATININGDGNNVAVNSTNIDQKTSIQLKGKKSDTWWQYSGIAGFITFLVILWIFNSWFYAIIGGLFSSLIVWKSNPKFRFRNIGYALLWSGVLSNIISFSGVITIQKNDFIHGVVKFGDNDFPILLIGLSFLFFILDYFENKN